MLVGTEYVLNIGQIQFIYYSAKSLNELSDYFRILMEQDKPFVIEMGVPTNMNGLPQLIVKPSPGMVVIVQSKQDFERNAKMQQLVGVNRA